MIFNTENRVKMLKKSRSLHITEAVSFLVMLKLSFNVLKIGIVVGSNKEIIVKKHVGAELLMTASDNVKGFPVKGPGASENMSRIKFIFILKGGNRSKVFGNLIGQIGVDPTVDRLSVIFLSKYRRADTFGAVHP